MGKHSFLKSSLIIAAAATTTLAFVPKVNAATPSVAFDAHIQGTGWESSVKASNSIEGAVFGGTTGLSKRLEAVKINAMGIAPSAKISYRAHVQTYGWQDWVEAGSTAGTEGESKRMEGLEISVEGLTGYVVKYRVHVQTYGWQDWVTATNSKAENKAAPTVGTFAGTTNQSKRIEAIEIVILSNAENDLLTLKEKAIKQLVSQFNPADYTVNAEEFNQKMEKAKKDINAVTSSGDIDKTLQAGITALQGVKSDSKLAEELETAKTTKLSAFETTFLTTINSNVAGSTIQKYIERPTVKAAVDSAKALIKAAKTEEELDAAVLKAKSDVYDAVAKDVRALLDELYGNNVNSTNDNQKVLKDADYEQGIKDLEDAVAVKPEVVNDNGSDLTTLTTAYSTAQGKLAVLGTVRKKLENAVKGIGTGTLVGTIATDETHSEGEKVGARTADVTKYAELPDIKAMLEEKEKAITEAKLYSEMVAYKDEAKAETLRLLQAYMNAVVQGMMEPKNESQYILEERNITADYKKYSQSTDFADVARLIAAYRATLGKSTLQAS